MGRYPDPKSIEKSHPQLYTITWSRKKEATRTVWDNMYDLDRYFKGGFFVIKARVWPSKVENTIVLSRNSINYIHIREQTKYYGND